ncbi:hypothetical protein FOL47_002528 [Perkinsus chesapeaki]|uniref:hydroxymethylbilane synthase n=1 Tax=Perkinsus chesapeaki TaxID=330153 RepID=A0A7J6N077_PERCH|nr:hypothetical protein FOL47_002528 [Perkinsus chesapeaki]
MATEGHPVTLHIGSRRSDLARLQTLMVADLLEQEMDDVKIECHYREAPGDANLKDPLWKMPETGVFTTFLRDGLLDGSFDLVVHSWKDLPLAEEPGTTVASTLPRADPRDMIIIRKDALPEIAANGGTLIVLSSSPRRQFNLTPFLNTVVPGVSTVQFRDVRGNIQTRMRKLMDPEMHDDTLGPRPHGLVLAKAAVDRFVRSTKDEFKESRELVKGFVASCYCMVLPLSSNPTAAAQGALGIEVSTAPEKEYVRKMVKVLNDRSTFDAAWKEKEILNSTRAVKHVEGRSSSSCFVDDIDKIGCTILPRSYGTVTFLCGRTHAGLDLLDRRITPKNALLDDLRLKEGDPAPLQVGGAGGMSLFEREVVKDAGEKLMGMLRDGGQEFGLWISKASALPSSPDKLIETINSMGIPVWVAGTTSWKQLAKKGLWCTGSADSLGVQEDPDLSALAPKLKRWVKVTHCDAAEKQHATAAFGEAVRMDALGTYTLKPKYSVESCPADLKTATHIFWGSGSAFSEARRLATGLVDRVKVHGCGPGHTYEALRGAGIPEERITVCLNFSEFCDRVGGGEHSMRKKQKT